MRILLFVTLCITTFCKAQHNFSFDDNLIWSNIYTNNVTAEQLNTFIKTKGAQSYIEDYVVNFTIKFDNTNLKPFGFKSLEFPTYIQFGGNYTGFVQFKNQKYKVTITRIEVVDVLDNSLSISLSEYVIKKNKISDKAMHQKTLQMLDAYFANTFTYKTTSDW